MSVPFANQTEVKINLLKSSLNKFLYSLNGIFKTFGLYHSVVNRCLSLSNTDSLTLAWPAGCSTPDETVNHVHG